MEQKQSTENWEEVGSQLGCPNGDFGIEVGKSMEETNGNVIRKTMDVLRAGDYHKVLEIGHGNGSHVQYLLRSSENLNYQGLEISRIMHEEAVATNLQFVQKNRARFHLYDGLHIPHEDKEFDAIFTVNTLYFWKHPEQFLAELYRVLKDTGSLIISFVSKESMENLPFIGNNFNLYDLEKAKTLINTTKFEIKQVISDSEHVKTNAGEVVERDYFIIQLEK